MEVSKLEVSKETRTYGSVQRKTLEWLFEHPKAVRQTNMVNIAKAIALEPGNRESTLSIRQALNRLIEKEMLYKRGSGRRYDLYFNLYHHRFPQDLARKYADSVEHDGKIVTTKLSPGPSSRPLRELILEYINEHPDKPSTVKEMAESIKREHATRPINSLIAVINKLIRQGDVKCESRRELGAGKYVFSLASSESKTPVSDVPVQISTEQGAIAITITLNLNIKSDK